MTHDFMRPSCGDVWGSCKCATRATVCAAALEVSGRGTGEGACACVWGGKGATAPCSMCWSTGCGAAGGAGMLGSRLRRLEGRGGSPCIVGSLCGGEETGSLTEVKEG